jgi:hypothetical protein
MIQFPAAHGGAQISIMINPTAPRGADALYLAYQVDSIGPFVNMRQYCASSRA